MKTEVEHAFQDMQEGLRDHDGGPTIDVDAESLQTVLRWAEKHGLRPDYAEGDRVRLKRSGTLEKGVHPFPWLREGDRGTVYSVDANIGHGGCVRVLWDTDPRDEPYPQFFTPRALERVYE